MKLKLRYNEMDAQALRHVCSGARAYARLQYLDISFNAVGSAGAEALSVFLENDACLRTLAAENVSHGRVVCCMVRGWYPGRA
jgi:hypothetical protein